ncbi:hypothetical protein CcCBS67573_g06550 [Chytriomyces confervae]|uniref:Uncharacterized protein n=1 Tax=Chytriomyces confervae TaxID=246404 RepID=A0A507F511_9FUNG|nr:hypothetical protein CcCBS67573_g06550 [Chytriomyces confervae]
MAAKSKFKDEHPFGELGLNQDPMLKRSSPFIR